MEINVKENRLVRRIGKKFIRMLLLLVTVSIVTFTLVSMSPIDPLQANVGQAALGAMSQEQKARLEEYWGVNTPPVRRYLNWAKAFLSGDMGTSLLYRQPVNRVIGVKLANSLFLMDRLADFRYPGTAFGDACRYLPGNLARQGDQGLFPVDFQYACVLAGASSASCLCRVAEGASYRLKRAHRRGGVGCDLF